MRVDLNSAEGSPLVVATPEEFREFYSYEDARAWLSAFAHDPMNIEEMRRALTDQLGYGAVWHLTDHEVLDHTAREMTRGCVAYVGEDLPPIVSPPKSLPKPFPTLSLAALADLIKDLPKLPLDLIPDAIVPPEFPRLAAVEVGALDFEAKKLQLSMDLLRFVGSATPPETDVAKALLDGAIRMGSVTRQAVGDAGSGLESLASSGQLGGAVSDLAKSLGVSNGALVNALVDASAGNNTAIADILAGTGLSDVEQSAIGAALANTGSGVAALHQATGQTGDDLAKISMGGEAPPAVTSALAAAMGDTDTSQKALVSGAHGAAALLANLTQKVADGELEASEVSAAFQGISTEQVEALAGLTGEMGDGMGAAAALATIQGADPSELGDFFRRMSGNQGDRIGDLSGNVGSDLSSLIGGDGGSGADEAGLDLSAPDVEPGFAWVRFQLIDDTTGKPAKGVRLQLRAGDEVHEIVTDADGMVEITNLPDGSFDIERIEDKLSREVVSVEGVEPPPDD